MYIKERPVYRIDSSYLLYSLDQLIFQSKYILYIKPCISVCFRVVNDKLERPSIILISPIWDRGQNQLMEIYNQHFIQYAITSLVFLAVGCFKSRIMRNQTNMARILKVLNLREHLRLTSHPSLSVFLWKLVVWHKVLRSREGSQKSFKCWVLLKRIKLFLQLPKITKNLRECSQTQKLQPIIAKVKPKRSTFCSLELPHTQFVTLKCWPWEGFFNK